jgi:hypothetical protein
MAVSNQKPKFLKIKLANNFQSDCIIIEKLETYHL